MKRIKFISSITQEDVLDVTLHLKGPTLVKFALNYRANIKGEWREIYRVDNFHGFLHEQRFWRSPKPIRIDSNKALSEQIIHYRNQIMINYQRYRQYYEDNNER